MQQWNNKLSKAEWTGEAKVDAAETFFQWEKEKHGSITGFRNNSFKSIYTGHQVSFYSSYKIET